MCTLTWIDLKLIMTSQLTQNRTLGVHSVQELTVVTWSLHLPEPKSIKKGFGRLDSNGIMNIKSKTLGMSLLFLNTKNLKQTIGNIWPSNSHLYSSRKQDVDKKKKWPHVAMAQLYIFKNKVLPYEWLNYNVFTAVVNCPCWH